ncbi:CHAD domain-containing protein [Sulfurimonas sp. CVO]|jgi:CHAD domain-containing protein|uniref:CHAD domain-containing protein n=1 Tax=Sulfurimonas sp. CVO TaxID=2283483 RepID=UPI00132EFDDE|nr:CHAD domain-containing protein [Sulfurimonas sp. CVO]QHG90968.1 CHAD domain-containing protein [Sulfurimonas sp. CVO]
MKNEQITKKLKEFKKLIKHFIKNSLDSTDDIHALRIKCRELFSLLNDNDNLAKDIKKIISFSNDIRDIDVFFNEYLKNLPTKYKKEVEREIFLKNNERERKKKIKKLYKYLKILKVPKSVANKKEEHFTQNLVFMEFPELDRKKLHKYRIYIKKRLYIEKNSFDRDDKKIKTLTNIKDALGTINDNYNALKRLRSYDIKSKVYKKIEKYTQNQNQKIYKKLKKSL